MALSSLQNKFNGQLWAELNAHSTLPYIFSQVGVVWDYIDAQLREQLRNDIR